MTKVARIPRPAEAGGRDDVNPSAFHLSGGVIRRTVFFGLVAATTLAMTAGMAGIQAANGFEPLEVAILLLFALNIVWVVLAAWTALAGFVVDALSLDPVSLKPRPNLRPALPASLRTRTAVVMAVRHEDPIRIAAGFEAIAADLARTGEAQAFDLWLLSGSTQADVLENERRQWAALTRRLGPRHWAYYWKRDETAGRKAGTIADFLRHWGGHYEHMVVLDADSLMGGSTLVELVRLMEANPTVGLIQTVPQPINQTTLFGRILQFASHLYGSVFAAGAAFWQLGEGNYYGHNAIIRVAAFARHAALPELPGSPPLGGEILSHDFVEAAMLRRAGWHVITIPHLGGSFEELPSNLLDYAARDRRWCQGNLQHLKVLRWPRLHPISRLHLFSGAFAFIASPVWLAFLLLSTASMVEEALGYHDYFPGGYRLFPDWPISMWTESVSLVAVTLCLLFLPKVLAVVLTLARREQRRRFGGVAPVLAGTLVETAFSILLAPIMMALHTSFVAALAAGRSVGWNVQNRSERGLTLAEAGSRLGILFVVAVAWGTLMAVAVPERLWWILPVLAGLAVSIPVAVLSSRGSLGSLTRQAGLLTTPQETDPDPVIVAAQEYAVRAAAGAAEPVPPGSLPLPPLAATAMQPFPHVRPADRPRLAQVGG